MADEELTAKWMENPGIPCDFCGKPLAAAEVATAPPDLGDKPILLVADTRCGNPDCPDYSGLKKGAVSGSS
jgi:hypothetical protein